MNPSPTRIACVFGTRPEAIKMAPVIKELQRARSGGLSFDVKVCVTAQHREMLDQVLHWFDILPDYDLNLMRPDQNLFALSARLIQTMGTVLEDIRPSLVLVHGDTTTTLCTALAAFYLQIKVGHVEAGLRSHQKYQPFPEEANRHITAVLADYHFCPTETARSNLLREGINDKTIIVTGNTVIDAIQYTLGKMHATPSGTLRFEQQFPYLTSIAGDKKLIVVTGHRRENFGVGLQNICTALKDIIDQNDDVEIVYPVHLNPNVKRPVQEYLGRTERIWLIDPLDYQPFVYLMHKAYIVLTDSGGIQEEAPTLGKPVLVMRNVTERPEAVEAGAVKLVGTDPLQITREVNRLLRDPTEYHKMSTARSPYGDGRAAARIVDFLSKEIIGNEASSENLQFYLSSDQCPSRATDLADRK